LAELLAIIGNLANDESLPARHRDHALVGNWRHHRECHVRPDWLSIYRLTPGTLTLVRTGSHAELFER
jgi:mRNA interferase YafQ